MDNYKIEQKKLVSELEANFKNNNIKTTIVEMRKDYADDNQICLSLVAFVDDDIRQNIISNIVEPLRKIEKDFYYYFPESIHITIKNVRTIHFPPNFNENDIEKVRNKFREIIEKFSVLEVSVEDVLLFPTSSSIMAYSSSKLFGDLVLALDKGLKDIGVPDDKKYLSDSVFWGNLTFCRFTHEPSGEFIKKLQELRNFKMGKMKISKLSLISCNGACHPSSKNIVEEFNLKII